MDQDCDFLFLMNVFYLSTHSGIFGIVFDSVTFLQISIINISSFFLQCIKFL